MADSKAKKELALSKNQGKYLNYYWDTQTDKQEELTRPARAKRKYQVKRIVIKTSIALKFSHENV